MPVVSQAQNGFMALSTTEVGRAKLRAHGKKPAPVAVAKEYQQAGKGISVKKLPRHTRKK